MLQPAGAPGTLQPEGVSAGAVLEADVEDGVGVGVEVGVEEGVGVGVLVRVAVGVGDVVVVGVGVGVAVCLGSVGVSPESDSFSFRILLLASTGATRCGALSSKSAAARRSHLVGAMTNKLSAPGTSGGQLIGGS